MAGNPGLLVFLGNADLSLSAFFGKSGDFLLFYRYCHLLFFALLFFGKSIGEIVFINIVFQLIAIATGLAIAYKEKSGGFFSKKRKSNTFDKSVNPV